MKTSLNLPHSDVFARCTPNNPDTCRSKSCHADAIDANAVHVEGVEPDYTCHGLCSRMVWNAQAPAFLLTKLEANTAKIRIPVPTCCR
jgi:hypothetical protein